MFESYHLCSDSNGDKMTSSLIVIAKKTSEEGELKCIVRNNLGSYVSMLTVKIIGRFDYITKCCHLKYF